MFNKKTLFFVTAMLYTAYILFPLLSDIITIPVWLPSILTVVVTLFLYPNAFRNKVFYWFLVYAVVLAVYLFMGRKLTIGIGTVEDEKKIFIEYAFLLPAIALFSVMCYLNDMRVIKQYVRWSIILLYVSFIVAVPLMQRYSSLRTAMDIHYYENMNIPGLPGYALMHAYTLFLPVMCYAIKVLRNGMKWMAFIGVVVLCYVIYDTFVTTSLILMISILIITWAYTGKNPGIFWFFVILSLLILYTFYLSGFFVLFIDWIRPVFEGTPVEVKLLDLRDSMTQGELTGSSIVVRREKHDSSWLSFLSNPLIGSGKVGEHSSLLDRFGGMGLFVGIPFVMIIVSYIKQMRVLYRTQFAKVFWGIGLVAGFVFLLEKGIWGAEGWLFYMVLMPMGILLLERKTQDYA